MGMLVTLYLISANVYNSLDAPASRGFRSRLSVYISGMLSWFLLECQLLDLGLYRTSRRENFQNQDCPETRRFPSRTPDF